MKKFAKITSLMIVLSFTAILFCQIPQTINFQGALKDANGEPVNSSQLFEFRIYNVLTGGTPLWTEQHFGVPISVGIFSVELGLTTPFSVDMFDYPDLYITYILGGETAEMSPRRRILSVPYSILADEANLALFADNADSLGGVPLSGFVQQDSLGNATITGTMTANAFVGDGSGLTGISSIYDSLYIHSTGPDTMTANSDYPALTITNSGAGCGVVASSIGPCFVVSSTGSDGFSVNSTATNGFSVYSALGNGVDIGSVGGDGVYIDSAGTTGLYVNSSIYDGVYVYNAGNPTSHSSINSNSGFEVAGAEGDGLYVGYTGVDGVHVKEAGDNGVHIESSLDFGVRIDSTGNDGIYFRKAGNPSAVSSDAAKKGLEIAGAEGSGVYVGNADQDGFSVISAGQAGFSVLGSNAEGVYVGWTGEDGVYVHNAGNPTTHQSNIYNNGFEVAGAEYCGLYVGYSDFSGVCVDSSMIGLEVNKVSHSGVWVHDAYWGLVVDDAEIGIQVDSATSFGVAANTLDINDEWGFYTDDKIRCLSVTYARACTNGKNDGNTLLEPGDIVCLSGYEENILGDSKVPIIKVTKADRYNSQTVIGVVEYKVAFGEEIKEFGKTDTNRGEIINIKSFRFVEGKARQGDYVSIITFGPADVKVDSRENIKAGESLTSNNGLAKKVRTTEINGITVAENVGILGKALEDSNGKSKIKVYVNCK